MTIEPCFRQLHVDRLIGDTVRAASKSKDGAEVILFDSGRFIVMLDGKTVGPSVTAWEVGF